MGGGMMSATCAFIPLHPAIRHAIEAGNGWTEMQELSCKMCGTLAHSENAGSRRIACYMCGIITFSPSACFNMLRPLEIHQGKSLPKPEDIDWLHVSEVRVQGRLSDDAKRIVDMALTNPKNKVIVRGMDLEARASIDSHVTGSNLE